MHGSLWIGRRVVLAGSLAKGSQLRMWVACLAVGVITGLLVAGIRLNLGLPGHKALLWMPPIIIARLLSHCSGGATTAGAALVGTTFGVGGHLAGGSSGAPLILIACAFLDLVIHLLERRRISAWLHVPAVGVAAMFANLICLGKRLFLPEGFGAHLLLNVSGFWARFCSYAFFGLAAGLIAATTAYYLQRGRRHPR
jgi:hypothetical protein